MCSVLDDFSQVIKERRLKEGMTQTDLANKCGLNYVTILHLERGDSIQMATFLKVCDVLGIKLTMKLCKTTKKK